MEGPVYKIAPQNLVHELRVSSSAGVPAGICELEWR